MKLGDTGYNGLYTKTHNGDCCGVMHIHYFPVVNATIAERVAWIEGAIGDCIRDYDGNYNWLTRDDWNKDDWSMGIEVILTPEQSDWFSALEEVGFKEVFRFDNSNSGNTCIVFYFNMGQS